MAKANISPTRSSRESAKAEVLPPLLVRYPKRMKRQKVYTVEVTWQRGKKYPPPAAGTVEPLTLRLIMAGAQVVPSERQLDPTRPRAKATFYVTPLALGWLKSERIEVLANGKKVQEIKIPSKVVTQRAFWGFLLLAFLVPWFLVTYIRPMPQYFPGKGENLEVKNLNVGQRFEKFIEKESIPLPKEAWDYFPDLAKFLTFELRAHGGEFMKLLWGYLQEYPIPAWCALVLVILALIAAFFHRDIKWYARGKPIPLTAVHSETPRGARRAAVQEEEEVMEVVE